MPSGSIPHGHERPDANKRHAEQVDNSNTIQDMTLDELQAQMDETLNAILQLTRQYMLQYNERWERSGIGQWGCGQISVAWFVNIAHWDGDAKDLQRQWDELSDQERGTGI